ncbi:MAG: DUF1223 domain-containing protein [Polyangiaceae bacterium]|nr:DUF1223 domain-containing protein [Polyangiaceae bacterium]
MSGKIMWMAALGIACAACGTSAAGGATSDVPPPEKQASAHERSMASTDRQDPGSEPATAGRPTVVVELFSSEGCSSCPPADILLREIATSRREDVDIIALELHVDYWNDLGWADPFSSEAYTSRQRSYAEALGDSRIYTPQMVVDGRTGFVGSQRGAASAAIARAAVAPKAKVTITRSASPEKVSVHVTDMPEPRPRSEVVLVLVEEGLTSQVTRGENAGSLLAHGPIVRTMKGIGTIAAGGRGEAFEGSETLTLPSTWNRERLRAVALVQAVESRVILGSGWVSMK